jgi:hypothetical protein
MMAKTRVSSLHVELCSLLGNIIHQELRYRVLKTECWTFDQQEILNEKGSLDFLVLYGTGSIHLEHSLDDRRYFKQGEPESKVDLRSASTPTTSATGNGWRLSLWLKFPNGEVVDLHFVRECGNSQFEKLRIYNTLPPDKIKFR